MTRRFALVSLAASPLLASGGLGPCAAARAEASLTSPEEPGIPMVVSGQVLHAGGTRPAAGVILYAYQADAKGLYGTHPLGGPRLRTWMRTDSDGRYRYHSIRPAPYPERTDPAHVHIQLWGGGAPLQYTEDLMFADDPLVSKARRERSARLGRFAFVREASMRNGVLTVEQDFELKTAADRFEEVILHGIRACS